MGSGGRFERRLHRFEKVFFFFVVEKIESVETSEENGYQVTEMKVKEKVIKDWNLE
jgi:hypothetical protein